MIPTIDDKRCQLVEALNALGGLEIHQRQALAWNKVDHTLACCAKHLGKHRNLGRVVWEMFDGRVFPKRIPGTLGSDVFVSSYDLNASHAIAPLPSLLGAEVGVGRDDVTGLQLVRLKTSRVVQYASPHGGGGLLVAAFVVPAIWTLVEFPEQGLAYRA